MLMQKKTPLAPVMPRYEKVDAASLLYSGNTRTPNKYKMPERKSANRRISSFLGM